MNEADRTYYCPYCGTEQGMMGHDCPMRKAGGGLTYVRGVDISDQLEAARVEEREACAKIADDEARHSLASSGDDAAGAAECIAAAIRARGKT